MGFLDAAHALQIREATRLGIPLIDALERFKHMGRGHPKRDTKQPKRDTKQPATASAVERRNEESLKQLQSLLGGVKPRG